MTKNAVSRRLPGHKPSFGSEELGAGNIGGNIDEILTYAFDADAHTSGRAETNTRTIIGDPPWPS